MFPMPAGHLENAGGTVNFAHPWEGLQTLTSLVLVQLGAAGKKSESFIAFNSLKKKKINQSCGNFFAERFGGWSQRSGKHYIKLMGRI